MITKGAESNKKLKLYKTIMKKISLKYIYTHRILIIERKLTDTDSNDISDTLISSSQWLAAWALLDSLKQLIGSTTNLSAHTLHRG